MTLSIALRKRISSLMKKKNMTLHKLALDSGIAYSTLSSFMHGQSNSPTLVTILHICEGFGMELKEFFDDDVFIDVDED